MLTATITFGANAQGAPVLAADDCAGRAAGHRHEVDRREPAYPPAGGDRAVEAPGVRASRPGRRDGGPRRHVTALDEALKYVAGRLAANADVRVDEAGRIHVTSDKAIAEPPSLVD